ncbi:MAG: translation initiation factor IF-2 [Prevotella histicola]|uniref:translation initiation factor IF-2 n=1 Tax=Prevotella histicola TaxID=470565 RepID=UPI001C5FA5A4|nr:translation initiation factor IF-2 [Prevotella histicola]MBF1403121.1 translation initiation factor IF-2 [Prevotella histicola]MBF1410832.1 translation initiation factor IF-2 [Prevotella histicola]MBF1422078.1 translation initiation factor IF-2 [Prevotella histicola]MBF1425798.1 translation initiation factor IF-2 [Prevotella histicola]MBW4739980.1 translation initiation factor IF-2 [Prevotella histicola]
MSIRLNKAIRELNVGLQTAVEFLEKKPELGEVKSDLNFKLSEEQYKALVGAFKNDQEVKKDAAKLFQKKPKEKKSSGNNHKAEAILDSGRPKYKPVGKIDLDQLNKPTAKKSVAPTEEKSAPEAAAAVSPAKENVVKEQPSAVEKPIVKEEKKPVENKVEEPVKAPVEKKPEAPKAEAPKKEAPVVKTETEPVVKEEPVVEDKKQEDGLFQTKNEKKMLNTPKVNVLGKIDLSSLNQSTRPKKKSKEERRKEREEKAGQNNGQGKKKRVRINKERVDINAAANQQQNQNGKKGGNNGNNKNGGKKNRNRNQKPLEVDDEAVARQVKETLARLTSKSQNKKGAKYRKEKRDAVQERLNAEAKAERKESKILKLTEFVTVSELATMMNVPVTNVISTLMSVGIMVSINQRLDAETINLVADEFDFKTEYVSAEVQEAVSEEVDDENDLVSRAPIVTVMGHVDHGKTSLLDHIRNTNVIAGEAGGITQHIGAYSVTLENGRKVTFLDTPGHEAFTAMRARGAQVTDIVIIIIAADDSVMPTTKEAIAHAQAAGVPMVFAINKIDKPGANPDKIREDLSQMNLLVEEWGGKYQCQEISAKKGLGVNELLDKVLLEADMMDLKANPNRKATGTIIESSLDKGRGYVSTVLVSNGTLKIGDNVIAGTSWGRIKAMFNERNQRIESAGPAEPAIILGLNGAPTAGDTFHVMETEQEAREIANKREQLQREQGLRTQTRLTLSDISHRIARGEFHEMNIIVKGDTDGSIEALSDSFIKLSTEKVKVNVISKAVGQISENDVMLASASDAVIVGFQVRPSADARRLADREGVEINTYSVIYDAIDDVKSTMVGMLDKVKKEIVTGQFEVKQVFKISKVGTVAGGMVTEGKVHSKDKGRVVRDGIVIHTAPIDALKRYKDDVKEVATGLECGISLVNYNDLQVGDIIETFTEIEVEQKL